MINEIEEFKAYTEPVHYASAGKRDTAYLGRFIFDTFLSFEGLTRVLTIIASFRSLLLKMVLVGFTITLNQLQNL